MEKEILAQDKPKRKTKKPLTKRGKRLIIVFSAVAVLLFITVWAIIANTYLTVTTFSIKSENIPSAFDGYKIAHVSDIHDSEIGEEHKTLLDKLKQSNPDMIAITGDLIDSSRTNVEHSLRFVAEAVKIAPCYYVCGNHEILSGKYEELREALLDLGVILLENTNKKIEKDGEYISIMGINDPFLYSFDLITHEYDETVVGECIEEALVGTDGFRILLSHHPECFEYYREYGIDLTLSGHAHGGQFRLPLIGGLYAPHQGVFPKYDAGLFKNGSTRMIVSRGIGNSAFPLRLNNNPELIIIELDSAR